MAWHQINTKKFLLFHNLFIRSHYVFMYPFVSWQLSYFSMHWFLTISIIMLECQAETQKDKNLISDLIKTIQSSVFHVSSIQTGRDNIVHNLESNQVNMKESMKSYRCPWFPVISNLPIMNTCIFVDEYFPYFHKATSISLSSSSNY